jgi:hypothetical protein
MIILDRLTGNVADDFQGFMVNSLFGDLEASKIPRPWRAPVPREIARRAQHPSTNPETPRQLRA